MCLRGPVLCPTQTPAHTHARFMPLSPPPLPIPCRWKSIVKCYSLFVVLFAAGSNLVFYFAFNTRRTNVAVEEINKLTSVGVSPLQGPAFKPRADPEPATGASYAWLANALYVEKGREGGCLCCFSLVCWRLLLRTESPYSSSLAMPLLPSCPCCVVPVFASGCLCPGPGLCLALRAPLPSFCWPPSCGASSGSSRRASV